MCKGGRLPKEGILPGGGKQEGAFLQAVHLLRTAKRKPCRILRHRRHSLHNLDDCAAQAVLTSAL